MVGAALALLLSAGAQAGEKRTYADWARRPTAQQILRLYPATALHDRKNGVATVTCKVTAEGAPVDCAVLAEDPPGYGFGEAAVEVAKLTWFHPATLDGVAVEQASVQIPVAFRKF